MLPPHNVKNLININSQISAFYLGIGTFEASMKICREFPKWIIWIYNVNVVPNIDHLNL